MCGHQQTVRLVVETGDGADGGAKVGGPGRRRSLDQQTHFPPPARPVGTTRRMERPQPSSYRREDCRPTGSSFGAGRPTGTRTQPCVCAPVCEPATDGPPPSSGRPSPRGVVAWGGGPVRRPVVLGLERGRGACFGLGMPGIQQALAPSPKSTRARQSRVVVAKAGPVSILPRGGTVTVGGTCARCAPQFCLGLKPKHVYSLCLWGAGLHGTVATSTHSAPLLDERTVAVSGWLPLWCVVRGHTLARVRGSFCKAGGVGNATKLTTFLSRCFSLALLPLS